MLFGGVKGIFLIFDILGTYFLASIHYILKKMSECLRTYGPQIICVPQLQIED